jgi:Domain of unknown function (DUF4365)
MSDKFPKRTPSQAEGELGVAIFATAVRQALGWEFRRTPQEVDYGVDGYLDLVSEGGDVTGKSIAVQIKSGRSYFQFSGDDWVYRGERKHINYYTNLGVPLILVLVDTESHQIWWRRFSAYETDGNPSGWTIRIPKSNLLHVQSRSELAQVAGVAEDNLSHMDEIWPCRRR